MQKHHKVTIFAIFSMLLLSQVSIMAFAHHNDKTGEKARQESEIKTKKINDDKDKKDQERKDAWKKYREAFKAWKTAKGNYKIVKSDGTQEQIENTKNILDEAYLKVMKAWKDYQKIKSQ